MDNFHQMLGNTLEGYNVSFWNGSLRSVRHDWTFRSGRVLHYGATATIDDVPQPPCTIVVGTRQNHTNR